MPLAAILRCLLGPVVLVVAFRSTLAQVRLARVAVFRSRLVLALAAPAQVAMSLLPVAMALPLVALFS
jgi:hypothetical protein